jgi:hypothetical protein
LEGDADGAFVEGVLELEIFEGLVVGREDFNVGVLFVFGPSVGHGEGIVSGMGGNSTGAGKKRFAWRRG